MNIEFVADSQNKKEKNKLIINGHEVCLKGIMNIQISLSADKEKPYLSVVAYGGKKKIEVIE